MLPKFVTPDQEDPHHSQPARAAILLERRFDLEDETATDAFGARFAHALLACREPSQQAQSSPQSSPQSLQRAPTPHTGFHVQLLGDLGAGKTSLVRATLRALGHGGRVRSPTYTLVEPYTVASTHGELQLYHFDLYRFSDPAEWADAGFREYFAAGAVCLVEWPQRAGGLLGVPDLVFSLEPGARGEGRVLTAHAYSASGKACLERC